MKIKHGPNKKRYQITLSPQAARMGRALARRERRNFSNLLEVLIDRAAAGNGHGRQPLKEAA